MSKMRKVDKLYVVLKLLFFSSLKNKIRKWLYTKRGNSFAKF